MEEKDFYFGNPNLARSGTRHEYTPEMIAEIKKCSSDPVYFIRNYMKIINVDKGLMNFEMYPFQEKFVEHINDNRNTIALMCRQVGKCLDKSGKIMVKCKSTGEVKEISAEDFFNIIKNKSKYGTSDL